jgi:hypothetical protein
MCEEDASMAMQVKAWMTRYLFKAWIGHFIKEMQKHSLEISPTNEHLLVLDGHRSHVSGVTMDVMKTTNMKIDILTLPSHMSHAMQLLDVFALNHMSKHSAYCKMCGPCVTSPVGLPKNELAKWMSEALEKGLSEQNIKSEFKTIGIFPFNSHAMDDKMEFYKEVGGIETIDLGALDNLQIVDGSFSYT